jgi:hypothetical protein
MATLLAPVIKAAGAAITAKDILFRNLGYVVIGDVDLTNLEIPSTIKWGGKQSVKVHELPGGDRVVDTVGRRDMALSWSGFLMGDVGKQKALLLDEIRIGGMPVTLAWGEHVYSVIVEDFTFDEMAFHTAYKISCVVVKDMASASQTLLQSLTQTVGADVQAALDLASQALAIGGLAVAVL